MRFFRRNRNVRRENGHNNDERNQSTALIPANESDVTRPLFGMNLFRNLVSLTRHQPFYNTHYSSLHSPLHLHTTYVPKCIGSTSASDILLGNHPMEDFSSNCWLQDHLNEFGNDVSQLNPETGQDIVTIAADIHQEENNAESERSFESSRSSIVLTENSGYSSDVDTGSFYFWPEQISDYTMIVEPPPYGFTDLPPTYEEATGHYDSRSFSSSTSSHSSRYRDVLY